MIIGTTFTFLQKDFTKSSQKMAEFSQIVLTEMHVFEFSMTIDSAVEVKGHNGKLY